MLGITCCNKTVCYGPHVTRQYAGYQMLRQYAGYQMLYDSMLDIKCYKTVCWILERLFDPMVDQQ